MADLVLFIVHTHSRCCAHTCIIFFPNYEYFNESHEPPKRWIKKGLSFKVKACLIMVCLSGWLDKILYHFKAQEKVFFPLFIDDYIKPSGIYQGRSLDLMSQSYNIKGSVSLISWWFMTFAPLLLKVLAKFHLKLLFECKDLMLAVVTYSRDIFSELRPLNVSKRLPELRGKKCNNLLKCIYPL